MEKCNYQCCSDRHWVYFKGLLKSNIVSRSVRLARPYCTDCNSPLKMCKAKRCSNKQGSKCDIFSPSTLLEEMHDHYDDKGHKPIMHSGFINLHSDVKNHVHLTHTQSSSMYFLRHTGTLFLPRNRNSHLPSSLSKLSIL